MPKSCRDPVLPRTWRSREGSAITRWFGNQPVSGVVAKAIALRNRVHNGAEGYRPPSVPRRRSCGLYRWQSSWNAAADGRYRVKGVSETIRGIVSTQNGRSPGWTRVRGKAASMAWGKPLRPSVTRQCICKANVTTGHDGDRDVLNAAVAQIARHLGPELGAFIRLAPQTQNVPCAVHSPAGSPSTGGGSPRASR